MRVIFDWLRGHHESDDRVDAALDDLKRARAEADRGVAEMRRETEKLVARAGASSSRVSDSVAERLSR